MECNKDEATRAIAIAEAKFEKKDYAGAKKFALKAQSLYPGLEGISHMLATLDVYISAENKISGEVDWYGVLGLNPLVDDETLKKQYRKLVLMLHPDKNKSIGADGAFKLLSEAWSLLSDKAKRLAYNQRRSLKGYQQKVQMHTAGPSAAPPRANGVHNFTSRTVPVQRTQKNAARVPPKTVPVPQQRVATFWTICHRCMMQYEYPKIYINQTLLCPSCHEPFLASETAPPVNFPSGSSNSAADQQHQGSSARPPSHNSFDPGRNAAASAKKSEPTPAGRSSCTYAELKRDLPPRTPSVNTTDPSVAGKAANVVQLAQEKMRKEHDARNSFSNEEAPLKKSRVGDDGNHFGANMAYQAAMGNNGFGTAFASGSSKGGYEASRVHGFPKPNSIRELTPVELRDMLTKKCRTEILKKLSEWKPKSATKAANTEKEKVKVTKQGKGSDVNGGDEATALVPMNVPDPDFHDFDVDRTENCFGDNEVWAAYDDSDGMPRFYALISKVISRKPFKVKISWLNSKTTTEFAPIDWVGSGFYKTCGEFRIGRYEINKSINSFSHKVSWSKGPRGSVLIFPKKGDIWALYRNWSPNWDERTSSEVIHKYDMVLVLDDYNEEQGVSVAPLVKVAGFRTVFEPLMEPEKITRVPREEMFRFSHMVPNYLLTGEEAQHAPKGCLELDPAASPMELLQVTTEDKEVKMAKNAESANVMERQSIV